MGWVVETGHGGTEGIRSGRGEEGKRVFPAGAN